MPKETETMVKCLNNGATVENVGHPTMETNVTKFLSASRRVDKNNGKQNFEILGKSAFLACGKNPFYGKFEN